MHTPSNISPPLCPACGYDLRGSPDERCPECGYRATQRERLATAQAVADARADIESVRGNIRMGWIVGGICTVVVVTLIAIDYTGIALLLAVFSGIGMVGCGLQCLRFHQVPHRARIETSNQTGTQISGVVLAIVGMVLIVLAFVS